MCRKHMSVSRHCLYEDYTSHFASAQVILGFGLGPAICPHSRIAERVLWGGPLLRLSGGEQIAQPDLLRIPSELEAYL